MVGGDDKGDDMAVELSWPNAQPVAARRAAAPASAIPAAGRPAPPPDGAPQAAPVPKLARSDAVTGAQLLSAIQRVGADVTAVGRAQQRVLGQAVRELSDRLANFEPVGGDPSIARGLHALGQRLTAIEAAANRVANDASVIANRVATDDGDPFDAVVDVLASVTRRQDELAAAMADVAEGLSDRSDLASVIEWAESRERLLTERLDRIEAALPRRTGAEGAPASAIEDTLFGVLEHLTTLSSLVTGTSRASAAELGALQRRIVQSLASLQKGLAERPLLSDVDVHRIADAVTESLLENVRVEAEEEEEED